MTDYKAALELIDEISEIDDSVEIMLLDGFEEALLGHATRFGGLSVAAYDLTKCIEILSRDMSFEDALEYFEFNVIGAWVGEGTPIFIQLPESTQE